MQEKNIPALGSLLAGIKKKELEVWRKGQNLA